MAVNVARKFASPFVSLSTMPLGFRYPRVPLGMLRRYLHYE